MTEEIVEIADWSYPTRIAVGAGRSRELADGCHQLGMQAPLLVTDPGLAALPFISDVKARCAEAGLRIESFTDVQGNPTRQNVEDGVEIFMAGQHDGVIAIGGGSALDAGKAIAFLSGQQRSLWDFEDLDDNWSRAREDGIAPIIAIPTTAGTGSEVGRVSVITDTAEKRKRLIFHPRILPSLVILDAELTLSLPAHLTAATGMDALSHNLEAYCSPRFHPMADGIAQEGIRRIVQYLPRAVADGNDLKARTQLLVASTMGATAFQKGLGAMHALAHPLGARYNAHHGLLNAILMPYVLQANRSAIAGKLTDLARALDIANPSFDAFFERVMVLREQIEIPERLLDIGIDANESVLIGELAVLDPPAATNPVAFSAGQYSALFRDAVEGNLTS
ncbi:MAG: iron-containing alcohol dehydrogenase [Proteobacteria bacterium]|nr:iron-containing alcohol dehydrogenase [Pseudomonadota bacterium]